MRRCRATSAGADRPDLRAGQGIAEDDPWARERKPASRCRDEASAFRKLTRPRGLVMKRALPADLRHRATGRFVSALNEKSISAAPPPPPVAGPTLEGVVDKIAGGYTREARFCRRSWWIVAALLALALLALLLIGGAAGLVLGGALAAGALAAFAIGQRARKVLEQLGKLRLSGLTPEALAASAAGQVRDHRAGHGRRRA